MSRQQSFVSEIPFNITSELREDETIESSEFNLTDRPNLNIVNAAIEAARIAKETYIAVLESEGYRMERVGSYEEVSYHMVHRSVSIEDLDYWGEPKDGIDPALVIPF